MISSLKSKFSSSTRRALIVSSDKLAVYHWAKNSLGNSYLFDTTKEGFEHFGRYLQEVPNDPVYILLDTAAEEYRLDTIPHVFGADRKAVIGRKQDRLFRGTPYLYTEVQGRQETGRRDDNIMLSAITNPNFIRPWLSILEEYKVPVASVISVPLLLQTIPDIIPDMSNNSLVFSLQSISGLRQSFFRDKALKFSRLVKMPRIGTEPYAPIISEELEKVRRYINSARIIDLSKPLDVYFLGNKTLLDELAKTHINSAMLRYHLLDVDTLVESCGLKGQMNTPFSDKYFVYQLLKNKSKNYYAMSKETRYFQMRQINKSLRIANLLLLMAGIVWGGLNVLEGFTYRQQHISDAKKADFYSVRYEVAQERLSALPVDPADLKVVVDAKDVIKTYKADPIAMFRTVSKGLDIYPDVQINDMQWAANTNPNYKLGKGGPNRDAGGGAQAILGFSNIDDTQTGYIYYQIALVDGYLDNFDGNYRNALATIDDFAETLRQQDSVHDVSIVTLPLDISSDANLEGSAQVDKRKSNFSLRIVLGVKNET